MGSGSSRIGTDRSSKPSRLNRTKRKLSSLLLCGRLTSNSNSQSSALVLESPISSIENLPPTSVESITSAGVSSSFFGSEPICTTSKTSESEPESCDISPKNPSVNPINCNDDRASTSYDDHPTQESVSGNYGSESDTRIEQNQQIDTSPITVEATQENLDSDSGRNHGDTARNADSDSDTRALLVLSDSFLSLRIFGGGLTNSGSGFFPSDVESDAVSGRILLVDSEARRNSGRFLGGDTSSRRGGSRRDSGFPAIFFSAGLDDDFGSTRDRWLLDISGDGYSRNHGRNEERRHFRSLMSERGLGERTRFCASGLHRDGTCSCGSSFMGGEETGSFGSISRVVLLAQALSEVLDEIHRQPLSLSMPMLSLPAPESVVDSFLLKSHKNIDASQTGPNYIQQCYICLVDYEEGDKIRVLPCRHEYHASCVDKWLKEVNGVCPVCRCNVCAAGAVSSSEVPA